ncbi:THUMP domain-containing protein [Syntrophus gentianae]|uniref:THUMP domain-containing protein n=1 Tax=Syntrophus gentianae TaxID=43775 RepID=A0A1H7WDY1_9BACT|nr:THUMP domain-containing protein [Syntrophus gentianae]SEM19776.1 THUMP domain-containing protein [Syntrophus gentianae]
MPEWNAVVNVYEHGWKEAFDKLSGFGLLTKTSFLNVLLLKADDMPMLLQRLQEGLEKDPASWRFLSRLIPVTTTFTFQSPEAFEERAKEAVLKWVPELAGRSFHVRMRRRGFKGKLSSMDEERFLDAFLLDALEKAGTPGHIAFDDPDAIIVIETVGSWAGLSLWNREDLHRHPFIRTD